MGADETLAANIGAVFPYWVDVHINRCMYLGIGEKDRIGSEAKAAGNCGAGISLLGLDVPGFPEIETGRGGCYLRLTPEQYLHLRRP
jgi:hypothetical protein